MTDDGDTRLAGPQRIGRYRVSELLGSGAMGMVYLGYDEAIARKVAIKTIHQHLLRGEQGADWLARFRLEVRAAGRCLHPNIVTIFEYGEQDGAPYLVMEYVQGRELRDYLKEGQPLPLPIAVSVIVQVLQALGHAHAGGVVHRDIKPGNIILLADGQVKVTDFGIARLDSVMGMTEAGMAIGTPGYISPEQFQGLEADRRTDIFAVGVVLFEVLTGVRPFTGHNASELMYQLLNEKPKRVTDIDPRLPLELNNVLDKALAKSPAFRFQDAGEFIAALENLKLVERLFRGDGPGTLLTATIPLPEPTTQAIQLQAQPPLLEQATRHLLPYLGPVAKVLVRKLATQIHNPAELIEKLSASIPSEADRVMFRRQMQTARSDTATHLPASAPAPSVGGSQMSAMLGPFDQAMLEAARRDLAVHVGPIAKVLVKQTAVKAMNLAELYERLAEHIPTAAERAAFMRRGEETKRILSLDRPKA